MFRQFAHCIRNYLHNCTFGAKLSFLFVPRIKSMKMRVSWLLTNVNSYLNFSISVWLTGNFGIPAIFHQITRILKLIFNNHAPGKFYKSFNIYVRRRGEACLKCKQRKYWHPTKMKNHSSIENDNNDLAVSQNFRQWKDQARWQYGHIVVLEKHAIIPNYSVWLC